MAIGGFWIAIHQINKTKSAVESAKIAALATRDNINNAWVMMLLTQLQRTEEELERAVESGSIELFVSWSNNWRWQAGQLRGHLQSLDSDNNSLLILIQKSVTVASMGKMAVKNGAIGDVRKNSKKTLEAVSAVTNELGALIAAYGSGKEMRNIDG